jgi:ABC-type polysaccharide/polyol phosphate export permease
MKRFSYQCYRIPSVGFIVLILLGNISKGKREKEKRKRKTENYIYSCIIIILHLLVGIVLLKRFKKKFFFKQ